MRPLRILLGSPSESAIYHCLSRVVDRTFRLGEKDQDEFLKFMREYEQFCDVRVLTYCILANHFHILVEIPPRPVVLPAAEVVLTRLKALSGGAVSPRKFDQTIKRLRAANDLAGERGYLEKFYRRMWNLSEFMKLLKQRFTCRFNRTRDRVGTLWEDRFKSTLVEKAPNPILTAAAYIDAHGLRAGIVTEVDEFPGCGYCAAIAGIEPAVAGIQMLARHLSGEDQTPTRALEFYRSQISGAAPGSDLAGTSEKFLSLGADRQAVIAALARRGTVPLNQLLLCRVNVLGNGLALGSREFTTAIGQRFTPRSMTGPNHGVHRLECLQNFELFTLRRWRPAAIS